MLITCPKCSTKYQIPTEAHLSVGRKVKCSHCQHVFTLSEQGISEMVVDNVIDSVLDNQNDTPQEVETVIDDQKVFEDQPVFQDDVPQPFVPVANAEVESKKSVGSWMAVFSLLFVLILLGVGVYYRDVLFDALSPQYNMPKTEKKEVNVTQQIEQSKEKKINVSALRSVTMPYVEETPDVVMLPQIQSVRFEKRTDPIPTIRIEGVLKNTTPTSMRLPTKVRAMAYNAEGAILFEKEIYLTDLILPAGEERPFFGSYQPAPDGVQWVDVTF